MCILFHYRCKFFLDEDKVHMFMCMMIICIAWTVAMKTSFAVIHGEQQNVQAIVLQENNNVTLLKEHNHPKLPLIKMQMEMKEEMLRLSRETHIGLKEIFDSVCRR